MASPTQWTWVWVNSGSWWWTGRPGVLQFMGLQRVGHKWATGLTELLVHRFATLSIVQPLLVASCEFWFVNDKHMLIMTVMSSNSIFIPCYGHSLSCVYLNPQNLIYPFPLWEPWSCFYVCESIPVLWIYSFVSFFLDSTYMQYHMIFVFLFIAYFT